MEAGSTTKGPRSPSNEFDLTGTFKGAVIAEWDRQANTSH
jgi:hypothetical protein